VRDSKCQRAIAEQRASTFFSVALLIRLSFSVALFALPLALQAQDVSNVTLPSEEELRNALNNGDITIEEFQLLLEYMYSSTFPDLTVVAGNIPNLDLIGAGALLRLDRLQQEQLDAIDAGGHSSGNARVRVYADQELNDRRRARSVYQFRLGQRVGWRVEGSVASAFGQTSLWRSRSLHWSNATNPTLSITLGNFNLRWGTGLAFGYRSRLLQRQTDLSYESFRTPDRGGFNGLSVLGQTPLDKNHKLRWQAIGSTQQDIAHRLNTTGVMGDITLADITVGALWARSELDIRDSSGSFVQNQFALSIKSARTASLWYNTEVNTQNNAGTHSVAVSAEWRYNTAAGNVRGAFWRYPRSYRNLTGGARSGLLYETLEFDDIGFSYRDRRVNQTGGLLRSVTALDGRNKLETGIEYSKQNRGSATRGDYILALLHQFERNELKLEAGGRSVTNSSTAVDSRWRLRAQFTSQFSSGHTQLQLRTALAYRKQVSDSPALGFFTRIRATVRNKQRLELWLDINRFRWWRGGLERLYSYIQYSAPVGASGAVSLLTKLVYSYNESSTNHSRVVARLEALAQW